MKKWLKCCATVCLLVLVIFCLYKYNNQQENGNNNYFVINNYKVIYETTNYKRLRIEDLDSNIALGIKENTKIPLVQQVKGILYRVLHHIPGAVWTYRKVRGK